jgi:site-specific recombinase XerD
MEVEIKVQQTLAPRILSPHQRFVLRTLIEKDGDLRGKAIFALGYWAGCRVSDIAHLRLEHAHIGPKIGWLHVGHKGEKFRDIDLLNEARRPLYDYLLHGGREQSSPYVFTSQRNDQLTEAGIHHWFRSLKRQSLYPGQPCTREREVTRSQRVIRQNALASCRKQSVSSVCSLEPTPCTHWLFRVRP